MLRWIARRFEESRSRLHERLLSKVTHPPRQDLTGSDSDWLKSGNEALASGALDEALRCYEEAGKLSRFALPALVNQGLVLIELDRYAQARNCLDAAMALGPDNLDAAYLHGLASERVGDLQQAISSLERAIVLKSDFIPAYRDLARILHQVGQSEKAKGLVADALRISPDSADLHFYRGNFLRLEGQDLSAANSFLEALRLDSQHIAARLNLAQLQMDAGNVDAACLNCELALQQNPDLPEFLVIAGSLLQRAGRPEEAAAQYRKALVLAPDHEDALPRLAGAMLDAGATEEALATARHAVRRLPNKAPGHIALGAALLASGNLEDARTSLSHALSLEPGNLDALLNMGSMELLTGHIDAAVDAYQAVLAQKPTHAIAQSNLLFATNYHESLSPESIYDRYRHFDFLIGTPLRSTWVPHANVPLQGRRLRIGYVSPDFRNHSVMRFLAPVLFNHDKGVVEIFAYAELRKEDTTSSMVKSLVAAWCNTAGMSDESLVQRIRADAIDVLVDLAGHTAGNRLAVFGRRPAPVCVSWLGYGYTTGLAAIDYFVSDAIICPHDADSLFSESPWRLNRTPYVYRPTEDMGGCGPLPALENGHVRFGTLTRPIRLNDHVVRTWALVLQRIPSSRLVVDSKAYGEPRLRDALYERFLAYGVSCDRLEFGFHSPPWDLLRTIDITLDCFPHNSGTTLFESLYMGVPFITLESRPSVGRLGSSILHGIGHPEWIARTEEEYVDLAVHLASNLPALSSIRHGLREEMRRSPLMDEAGFTRDLERAFLDMFTQWQTTRPPQEADTIRPHD